MNTPFVSIADSTVRVCDAHHHLWDPPPMPTWPAHYTLDDLTANAAQLGIPTSSIFVECRTGYRTDGPERLRPVGETETIEAELEKWRARTTVRDFNPCAAIVGFADLRLGGAVAEVVDAHRAASPTRFRGVRYQAAHDPDPGVRNAFTDPPAQLLGSPTFRDGLRELVARGLVFNAWVYHPQLWEVVELADALSDLSIVLEHCGGPLGMGPYLGRSVETLADWRGSIVELARRDNVSVKLGGLTMGLTGLANTVPADERNVAGAARLFEPWFLHLVEQFGVDRCMLECNYPFEELGLQYGELWEAYAIIFRSFAPTERAALFSGTAERVYGLS